MALRLSAILSQILEIGEIIRLNYIFASLRQENPLNFQAAMGVQHL
jgi:hypothetical protein